jgi:hypothetical protein
MAFVKIIFSLLSGLIILQLLYPLTTILLGRLLGREKTRPVSIHPRPSTTAVSLPHTKTPPLRGRCCSPS